MLEWEGEWWRMVEWEGLVNGEEVEYEEGG